MLGIGGVPAARLSLPMAGHDRPFHVVKSSANGKDAEVGTVGRRLGNPLASRTIAAVASAAQALPLAARTSRAKGCGTSPLSDESLPPPARGPRRTEFDGDQVWKLSRPHHQTVRHVAEHNVAIRRSFDGIVSDQACSGSFVTALYDAYSLAVAAGTSARQFVAAWPSDSRLARTPSRSPRDASARYGAGAPPWP